MYHVSAQGVDECIINVHYYYYLLHRLLFLLESTNVWKDRGFVAFSCTMNVMNLSLHGDRTYLAI